MAPAVSRLAQSSSRLLILVLTFALTLTIAFDLDLLLLILAFVFVAPACAVLLAELFLTSRWSASSDGRLGPAQCQSATALSA